MACSKSFSEPTMIPSLSAKYLAELPSSILFKNLKLKGITCVKCKKLPNLGEYFMICQENRHIVCAPCSKPKQSSERYPASSKMKLDCCSPELLERGRPEVFQRLVGCAKWECPYKEKGCTELLSGFRWENHVRKCTFQFMVHCYYYGCAAKTLGFAETLEHYVQTHNGIVIPMDDGNERLMTVTFDEEECTLKRKLGILKDNEENYYLFAMQMFNNGLLMWIWDMDKPKDKISRSSKKPNDKSYRLTLYVPKKESEEKVEINFKGLMQPLSKTCEAIIGSYDPRDCFKHCMDQLKMIYYKNWREGKTINEWTIKISIVLEDTTSELSKQFDYENWQCEQLLWKPYKSANKL